MTSISDVSVLDVGDVVGIAQAVWSSFLGIEVGVVASPPPRPPDDDLIFAYVLVGGAWQGGVVLACGQETAQRLASAMFALPGPVGKDDMGDAVGELANVLGGNVKSLLPQPSAISLPVVTSGTSYAHEPADAREVCHLDLNWAGETLSLRVWTRGDST